MNYFISNLLQWMYNLFNMLNKLTFIVGGVSIPYGWLIVGFLGLFMFLNTFVKGAKA